MKTAILGSGSYGTALGCILADKNHEIDIWTRRESIEESINQRHENETYVPGLKLPAHVKASRDIEKVLAGANLVILAIPTQSLTRVLTDYKDFFPRETPIVGAAKGIERGTLRLVNEILEEELPEVYHPYLAYLSGPSFAKEIIQQQPTAVSIASQNEELAREVQEIFSHKYFRTYWTSDVSGVEIGGALKNVIAIAAGFSDGLGLGHNPKAAIITRGLAEITRLGVARGADPMTFLGLSGMGDLVLTCTGGLSRNRTVGFKLGEGMKLPQILEEMNQVAEGVVTTESAYQLSQKMGISMAITEQMYQLLYEDKDPQSVVKDLMSRDLKKETN